MLTMMTKADWSGNRTGFRVDIGRSRRAGEDRRDGRERADRWLTREARTRVTARSSGSKVTPGPGVVGNRFLLDVPPLGDEDGVHDERRFGDGVATWWPSVAGADGFEGHR